MYYGIEDSDKAIERVMALEDARDSLRIAARDLDPDLDFDQIYEINNMIDLLEEEIREAQEVVDEHNSIFRSEELRGYYAAI